ncbi:DNA sulfur modification protein DndD [Alcanivorax marinus]|uniref:DNA sulfur modification protein DndD n=1 Tax=Alloalcanivorax marinus TaxID=1177169 RepID=A0A9Q3UIZ8_9GAMM|nr:DNA sulfur modification protein DndD [Alloalcanivorax marinus]MCC4307085.1 DNA sulfur modification protein DndD [Alloalcanivorax marinus]
MLIKELVLKNFRVYSGENRFDLSPRKRYGKSRPIVLFGGLNGAGKTSILSGVRLALYGKASLGPSVSQKRYEEYLRDSIHRNRRTGRSGSEAAVELSFSYAKLGTDSEFHVRRSWRRTSKSVKEDLHIYENGNPVKGLSYDQAQNFLNELIPIGVSDLFFFDGEKIAELADDTGGHALEQSIKKLLGLDVVERLSGDLTVLNRNLARKSSQKEIQEEIQVEKKNLDAHRSIIEEIRQEISTLGGKRSELAMHTKQLQKALEDRGGHFSSSRKDIERQVDSLNDKRQETITNIMEYLSDAAPIALAESFTRRLGEQLEDDLEAIAKQQELKSAAAYRAKLKAALKGKLKDESLIEVDSAFATLLQTDEKMHAEPIHDVTPAQASGIHSTFRLAADQSERAKALFSDLDNIEEDLDELGAALARAPDDSLIKADFDKLQKAQQELGGIDAQLDGLRSRAREEAGKALDNARRLDKLYEEAARHSDQSRVLQYISNANQLLSEFVDKTAKEKISDLEKQFTECFSRLARKDDLDLHIRVDPTTFNVDLVTSDGSLAAKDELSAGEKQIFAISILEALAKTSGRQLPMIVDTPLGRLDSHHRGKLIEGYFPTASHQMIVLSTDTEVDESFYKALSPDISRAYKLEYDSKTGATEAHEGYFWQSRKAG